jgi:hypothetical protein
VSLPTHKIFANILEFFCKREPYTRFLTSGFFVGISFPQTPEVYHGGHCYEISRRYHRYLQNR